MQVVYEKGGSRGTAPSAVPVQHRVNITFASDIRVVQMALERVAPAEPFAAPADEQPLRLSISNRGALRRDSIVVRMLHGHTTADPLPPLVRQDVALQVGHAPVRLYPAAMRALERRTFGRIREDGSRRVDLSIPRAGLATRDPRIAGKESRAWAFGGGVWRGRGGA